MTSRLDRANPKPEVQAVLGRLFLLFTLVPLAELYLLITIGNLMGLGPTIALVAATGFAGAWLAKREGRKALVNYQESLAKGQLPEDGIVSGLLLLAGGVMLITPGVMTDVFGLAMMVPPIRRAAAELVKKRVQNRIEAGEVKVVSLGSGGIGMNMGGGSGPGFGPRRGPGRADIVDTEVVEGEVVEGEVVGSTELRRRP